MFTVNSCLTLSKPKKGKLEKVWRYLVTIKRIIDVPVIKFSCKTTVVMCLVQYLENVTRQFRIIWYWPSELISYLCNKLLILHVLINPISNLLTQPLLLVGSMLNYLYPKQTNDYSILCDPSGQIKNTMIQLDYRYMFTSFSCHSHSSG